MWQLIAAAAIGAAQSSSSANKQAGAVDKASRRAVDSELEMFYESLDRSEPWRQVGLQALNKQASLLGLPGYTAPPPAEEDLSGIPMQQAQALIDDGSIERDGRLYQPAARGGLRYIGDVNQEQRTPQPIQVSQSATQEAADPTEVLRSTPGYQFALQESERGLKRRYAAMGLKDSGAYDRELARMRIGMADQLYDSMLQRYGMVSGNAQQVAVNQGNNAMVTGGRVAAQHNLAGAARAQGYDQQASALNNFINQGASAYAMHKYGASPTNYAMHKYGASPTNYGSALPVKPNMSGGFVY